MKPLTLCLAATALGASLAMASAMAQPARDAAPAGPAGNGGTAAAQGGGPTAVGPPVETRPANAPELKPAFAGQTRAPQPAAAPQVRQQVVAQGRRAPASPTSMPWDRRVPEQGRAIEVDGCATPGSPAARS